MNDQDEFIRKMENLNVPEITPLGHPAKVKMAIMNAERSATLGLWLVVVPCYFLLCVCMYYYFHVQIGWFGAMFTLLAGLDKTRYLDFLGPIILFVLPVIAIIINALAITHVQVQKHGPDQSKVREFSITIKFRLWNILLILISLIIIAVFLSYAMTQNISIKN